MFVDVVTVRVITLPTALLVPRKNLVSNTFKAMKAMAIIAVLKIWKPWEKDKQSRQWVLYFRFNFCQPKTAQQPH